MAWKQPETGVVGFPSEGAGGGSDTPSDVHAERKEQKGGKIAV